MYWATVLPAYKKTEESTILKPCFSRLFRKHHLFRKQFVADASDVQDLDAGIFGEAVTEAGDEDLEAAGVEEVVIAPEGKEDVLGGDDVAAAFA